MLKPGRIVLFVIFFLSSAWAFADHVAGGEMYYTYLAHNKYKISLKIYRDCAGFSSIINRSIKIRSLNASPAIGATQMLTLVSVTKLDLTCNSVKSNCYPGGTFPYGIEEYLFETVINLSNVFGFSPGSEYCRFYVSYQECCRAGSDNLNYANFHVSAEFDRCVANGNNSPVLHNPAVFILCNGQQANINPGATDLTDHDSISYELVSPMDTFQHAAHYQGTYTLSKPFQYLGAAAVNLTIDPVKGDLKFTPNAIQRVALAIKVNEWRRVGGSMVNIGSITRDFIFNSRLCSPNNPPQLIMDPPAAGNGLMQQFCAGKTNCFTIKALDKDTLSGRSDTTFISWNGAISQASFESLNKTARVSRADVATFCWTPGQDAIRSYPYYFVVSISDNNCPVPAFNSYAIGIMVNPDYEATIFPQKLSCQRYKLKAIFKNNQEPEEPFYEWAIATESNGIFTESTAQKFIDQEELIYQFSKAGSYVVRLRAGGAGNACVKEYFDTLKVSPPLKVSIAGRLEYCKGENLQLNAQITFGPSPHQFNWFLNNKPVSQAGPACNVPVHETGYLRLELTDANSCKAVDSVGLRVNALPVLPQFDSLSICYGDTILLDAGDNAGKGVKDYTWQGPGGISGNDRSLLVNQGGRYSITISNSKSCVSKDSLWVKVNAAVLPDAGPDLVVCDGVQLHIEAKGADTYEWFNLQNAMDYPAGLTDKELIWKASQDMFLLLKGQVRSGTMLCTGFDTLRIKVNPLPAVGVFMQDTLLCCNRPAFQPELLPDASGDLYLDGKLILSKQVEPCPSSSASRHELVYRFTDASSSCFNSDTLFFSTEKPLMLNISTKAAICSGDLIKVKAEKGSGVNSLQWSSDGSGSFTQLNDDSAFYQPSVADRQAGSVNIKSSSNQGLVCPAAERTVSVSIIPKPVGEMEASPRQFCGEHTVYFYTTFDKTYQFNWNFGDPGSTGNTSTFSTPIHHYSSSGNYSVALYVKNAEGCDTTLYQKDFIAIHKQPKADFSMYPSTATVANPVVSFVNLSANYSPEDSVRFTWKFNDPHSKVSAQKETIFAYPGELGKYYPTLVVQNRFGCFDTISKELNVVPPVSVFVPTAFKPASLIPDNNSLKVVADYFKTYNLKVFNRWGQQVFESNDPAHRWDGRSAGLECGDGVYSYRLSLQGWDNEMYYYNGTVQLLR